MFTLKMFKSDETVFKQLRGKKSGFFFSVFHNNFFFNVFFFSFYFFHFFLPKLFFKTFFFFKKEEILIFLSLFYTLKNSPEFQIR